MKSFWEGKGHISHDETADISLSSTGHVGMDMQALGAGASCQVLTESPLPGPVPMPRTWKGRTDPLHYLSENANVTKT